MMSKRNVFTNKKILQDAKKGKMFILVDDRDRENEGDLIIPGSKCNSKKYKFYGKTRQRFNLFSSIKKLTV